MKEKNKQREFQAIDGQVIEFVAIDWREGWDFDYPSSLIEPVTYFSTDGKSGGLLIEEALEQIICSKNNSLKDDKMLNDSFVKKLRKVTKDRFEGKKTWKTKFPRVYKYHIEFILNEDGELEYNTLKTEER